MLIVGKLIFEKITFSNAADPKVWTNTLSYIHSDTLLTEEISEYINTINEFNEEISKMLGEEKDNYTTIPKDALKFADGLDDVISTYVELEKDRKSDFINKITTGAGNTVITIMDNLLLHNSDMRNLAVFVDVKVNLISIIDNVGELVNRLSNVKWEDMFSSRIDNFVLNELKSGVVTLSGNLGKCLQFMRKELEYMNTIHDLYTKSRDITAETVDRLGEILKTTNFKVK